MKRYSDTAIEIINELHRERLDYQSEYLPLIDAANKLSAYEDTGLEPEQVMQTIATAGLSGPTREQVERIRSHWITVEELTDLQLCMELLEGAGYGADPVAAADQRAAKLLRWRERLDNNKPGRNREGGKRNDPQTV